MPLSVSVKQSASPPSDEQSLVSSHAVPTPASQLPTPSQSKSLQSMSPSPSSSPPLPQLPSQFGTGMQLFTTLPAVHDVAPVLAQAFKPQLVGVETKSSSTWPLQSLSMLLQLASFAAGVPGKQ